MATYGYTDGSGDWYITIDAEKCDGCARCVEVCPEDVFRVEFDDYDELIAVAVEEHRRMIKSSCDPCKLPGESKLEPCHIACPTNAISHSW